MRLEDDPVEQAAQLLKCALRGYGRHNGHDWREAAKAWFDGEYAAHVKRTYVWPTSEVLWEDGHLSDKADRNVSDPRDTAYSYHEPKRDRAYRLLSARGEDARKRLDSMTGPEVDALLAELTK